MRLCDEDHEEVCYEGSRCPACDVRSDKDREIAKLEKTNNDQLDTIFELETRSKELEAHIKELESKIQ